jgi:hypothetical protein
VIYCCSGKTVQEEENDLEDSEEAMSTARHKKIAIYLSFLYFKIHVRPPHFHV